MHALAKIGENVIRVPLLGRVGQVLAAALPIILAIGLTKCFGGDKTAIVSGALFGALFITVPALPIVIAAITAAGVAAYRMPTTSIFNYINTNIITYR